MAKYEKITDFYLSMVIPFCIVYISVLIGYSFYTNGMSDNSWLNVFYLVIVSFGFMYGVLAIIKDLKEHGYLKTLVYWCKKICDK